jgi:hypothetical protein
VNNAGPKTGAPMIVAYFTADLAHPFSNRFYLANHFLGIFWPTFSQNLRTHFFERFVPI